ncbi:MAG: hypothetical protein HOV97_04965 [Nonomuraea sp.]|nr:hypothetical protein [Nonomuraea sp.]
MSALQSQLDRFAFEVRSKLAEHIADGCEGDELRDQMVTTVETLLTCHWCGAGGMSPCACGEEDDA